MKIAITFVLVALCSLGSAQQQTVSYKFYKGSDEGQQAQFSKDQAGMFACVFQGMVCLYCEIQNGPHDKKAAAYGFLLPNLVQAVETYAASCGKSIYEIFPKQSDLDLYMKLRGIVDSGNYDDIDHIEGTCGALFSVFGAALGGLLSALGIVAGTALQMVTGLLGDAAGGIVGGITGTLNGLLGGALEGLLGGKGGLLGGLTGTLGGITGGVTGAVGGGGGGFLGGVTGAVGGGGGGFLG